MAGLIARALLWLSPTIASFVADIDLEQLEQPGLVIFAFVSVAAVNPDLPSESLLTTASNLAAQPESPKGWEALIVVRDDLRRAMEAAGSTGLSFARSRLSLARREPASVRGWWSSPAEQQMTCL